MTLIRSGAIGLHRHFEAHDKGVGLIVEFEHVRIGSVDLLEATARQKQASTFR